MLILILFSFLAGLATILSPCVLPLLPVILSSSTNEGKGRPVGVALGFVLSFTFFTLFLSSIVQLSNIPSDFLRSVSVFVLIIFGLSLLIPNLQIVFERLMGKLVNAVPHSQNKNGFGGGLIIGMSLGLLWTPCVGPILASVVSLAITGSVNFSSFLIVLAYSIGTSIPMAAVVIAGSNALKKVPWLLRNTGKIQKVFGVIMILTGIAVLFNFDRSFQTSVLTLLPKYGENLTQIEDNLAVREQLKKLDALPANNGTVGKPLLVSQEDKGVKSPEIASQGRWFNSDPLTIESLKGKVVLVDFWTYTCINCQRTLPYVKNWWEKYKDKNLVIIGVHTPEFEFEKVPENVEKALKDFGITYPVVQDNNYLTWRAFRNQYWPAKYLIDKKGNIRYTHFGEGEYDKTEGAIQELLKESGQEVTNKIENKDYQIYSQTQETYLGYKRIEYLESPESIVKDSFSNYSVPNSLTNNYFALGGEWNLSGEYAEPKPNAELQINFQSKEVFLVARPKEKEAKMQVYVDGVKQFYGEDAANGEVFVTTDRLYRIVKLENPGRHNLRIVFPEGKVELFAFTFG